MYQVRHKLRETFIFPLCKPILDGDVFSFNPSKLAQLLPERLHEDRATSSSAIIQETYPGDFCLLLRIGGQAKREEQSAKSKDGYCFLHVFFFCLDPLVTRHLTLAPPHLITLSARNSTDCGIVRFSAFAVLRLITNSNFVGCSTGRSAGLAPFRILST